VDNVTGISCFGNSNGSITVSASNGVEPYLYSISGGDFGESNTFNGLFGGSYTISAMDAEGCVSMSDIVVSEPSELLAEIVAEIPASCDYLNDGQITVNVSGGTAPYEIGSLVLESAGDTTYSPMLLPGGPYLVTVTDANDCTVELTYMISSPGTLGLATDFGDVNCTTGALGVITFTTFGGTLPHTYLINGEVVDTTYLFDLLPGQYLIEVEDANGCLNEDEIEIGTQGSLSIDSFEVTNVTCNGNEDGSLGNIFVSGGNGVYTYSLSGNINTTGVFAPLAPGGYNLGVSDEWGCEEQVDVLVTEPEPLSVEITSFTNDDGSTNGSISVTVSGGTSPYRYSIDGGTTTQDSSEFTGLENATYTITVEDENGCLIEITQVLTSINNLILQNVELFPNPSENYLNIKVLEKGAIFYKIYNTNGNAIINNSLSNGENIDISIIPSGIYIIEIRANNKSIKKKFIKLE